MAKQGYTKLIKPVLFSLPYEKYIQMYCWTKRTEGVARRCSVKMVLLKIDQYSKEDIRARASFSIKF